MTTLFLPLDVIECFALSLSADLKPTPHRRRQCRQRAGSVKFRTDLPEPNWPIGTRNNFPVARCNVIRCCRAVNQRNCNTCLADGPLGAGGQSARRRPDTYLDGRGTHLSFLPPSSLRPEPSGARALAPPAPLPSISILRPPNLDSSRGNLPRCILHLPKPLDRLLTSGIAPTTAGHHWRCLKLCSTVDPPLRSSSARTDRGNGFVVSSLCFPVFSPSVMCRRVSLAEY